MSPELFEDHTRTELLKTHKKPDNSKKILQDVVTEARAIGCAKQKNKLIALIEVEHVKSARLSMSLCQNEAIGSSSL